MKLLHNIGTYKHSNYNTRQQVEACQDQLSFDGIYLNVWENRDLLLKKNDPTVLFIMGNYVDQDNSFDLDNGLPLERYCNWNQLFQLRNEYGCVFGWHSWSHRDLTLLSDEEVLKEVSPLGYNPEIHSDFYKFMDFKYFAYPYGKVDERVEKIVRSVGYEDAFSVNRGHGGSFQRERSYLV